MCSHQENVKKNIKTSKRPKGMGQVVGHYPTKLEALIYPNTTKKKKKAIKKIQQSFKNRACITTRQR
jgi:hypothetical protein